MIIDVCLFRLRAQILLLESVFSAVFNEVRSALAELEGYILPDTLLPQGKHPVVIHGPGTSVGFASGYHQFHTGQILLQVDGRNHGLADDVFVFDGKLRENPQPFVGPLLVFHGASNDHIVPAVALVFRDAVQKPLDPLGQK